VAALLPVRRPRARLIQVALKASLTDRLTAGSFYGDTAGLLKASQSLFPLVSDIKLFLQYTAQHFPTD